MLRHTLSRAWYATERVASATPRLVTRGAYSLASPRFLESHMGPGSVPARIPEPRRTECEPRWPQTLGFALADLFFLPLYPRAGHGLPVGPARHQAGKHPSSPTQHARNFFGRSNANAVPLESSAQTAHLRDLNRRSPEKVVTLYESGAVAATEANLGEYLKALVRVDRLSDSALLRTLQRGAAAEAAGGSVGAGSGGRNAASAIMTGGGGGGVAGAMGSAGASSSAAAAGTLGTSTSPIYTQQLEATFKSQIWRTIRTLGIAFVVLSGYVFSRFPKSNGHCSPPPYVTVY